MILSETANRLFELLDEMTKKENAMVQVVKMLNGDINHYLGKEMFMVENLIVYELGGNLGDCESDSIIEAFSAYQYNKVSREDLVKNVVALILKEN